ncbi:hypothetical protein Trydic_g5669 [Trypoxylus dichotomus]
MQSSSSKPSISQKNTRLSACSKKDSRSEQCMGNKVIRRLASSFCFQSYPNREEASSVLSREVYVVRMFNQSTKICHPSGHHMLTLVAQKNLRRHDARLN